MSAKLIWSGCTAFFAESWRTAGAAGRGTKRAAACEGRPKPQMIISRAFLVAENDNNREWWRP